MSSVVRLPVELRQFLELPGPQSLLIRGPPGSGKTTLGLALLEAAAGTRVLLTHRVSTSELNREFPWLGENGAASIELVDASEMDVSLQGISHVAGQATIAYEPGSRDREALSEFLGLPPPVQEAYSRLPAGSPSTVVIDSWDALVEHYLGRRRARPDDSLDRPELERMLLRWMGRSPTHLVLVLETEAQTQLDYLVNGVVVTRRELVNDRLERWMHLPKLRGIRIANATYPYTVEGAKFQCIEPVRPYTTFTRGHFDPQPDPIPGYIWPGSKAFADSFGRLAVGRLTLMEMGDDVPDSVAQNLVYPMKVHSLRAGGRVLVIPSTALSPDDIWGPIEDARIPGHLAETFRVLDASGQLERGLRGGPSERLASLISLRSFPPPDPDRDPDDNEISRWLRGGVAGGAPGVVVMHASGLEALAAAMKTPITPQVAAGLPASIQATLGPNHLHLIAIVRTSSALFDPIRTLATIHLRLLNRQGRVLIYGSKPWTPGFVLAESANSGPYDLLRIV